MLSLCDSPQAVQFASYIGSMSSSRSTISCLTSNLRPRGDAQLLLRPQGRALTQEEFLNDVSIQEELEKTCFLFLSSSEATQQNHTKCCKRVYDHGCL
ncbi:hypothetical protein Pcinc_015847 [Petrolisthes cinctipes]|uniref:Uncharacterized protein n=1 Tax=Petrolisthes cinctipes TaxID=88211 RepID=A0AAE1KMN1_PETCI|nr:hypothetical protein Pcinc_015847 [Petrolisthes cinctipes]